jgi:hypothetical protein
LPYENIFSLTLAKMKMGDKPAIGTCLPNIAAGVPMDALFYRNF